MHVSELVGWGTETIYAATVTIVLFFAAIGVRRWMLQEIEPQHAHYFFDRFEATSGAAGDNSAQVVDLESFEGLEPADHRLGPFEIFAKRLVDIVMSCGLAFALAPLLALTALAIKLESPGPALYRQKRVGQNCKVFEVFKFRSMRIDAEKDGPQWASLNDIRITRIGRIIRKLRIDEIPQVINVLRGEMSFVGPRPERPEFVEILAERIPHYHSRHIVRPGITGWAQVKHEYTSTVEGAREKLKYDLYYVKKFTPLLDILIIVMTVRVVMFGIGSR